MAWQETLFFVFSATDTWYESSSVCFFSSFSFSATPERRGDGGGGMANEEEEEEEKGGQASIGLTSAVYCSRIIRSHASLLLLWLCGVVGMGGWCHSVAGDEAGGTVAASSFAMPLVSCERGGEARWFASIGSRVWGRRRARPGARDGDDKEEEEDGRVWESSTFILASVSSSSFGGGGGGGPSSSSSASCCNANSHKQVTIFSCCRTSCRREVLDGSRWAATCTAWVGRERGERGEVLAALPSTG